MMKTIRQRRCSMFILIGLFLSIIVMPTRVVNAQQKPTIHALLVIMDGDPNNSEQYKANAKWVGNLLQRVKNKDVCELELTILNSDTEDASKQPTPERVLEWIADLNPLRNDVVFLYYCGHGGRVNGAPDGGTYFDLDGANLFRKDVVDKLKSSSAWGCRLKMLITDTCAVQTMNIETPEGFAGTSASASYKAERAYRQLFIEHEGFLHLTSATENEYSWGDPKNGGWFTNGLVASINSHADADGRFVGWNEIFTSTEKKVVKLIADHQREVGDKIQHPKKYGEFPKALRSPGDLARWANRDERPVSQNNTQDTAQIRKIALSLTKITDETPLQRLQIDIQFSVGNLTDEEVKAQAYFFYQDGRMLKDADSKSAKRYGAVNGQVSVGEQVKATANEATLLIPTSQLHLPRGEHALEIVAVIRSTDGKELVRSIKSFEFTRR